MPSEARKDLRFEARAMEPQEYALPLECRHSNRFCPEIRYGFAAATDTDTVRVGLEALIRGYGFPTPMGTARPRTSRAGYSSMLLEDGKVKTQGETTLEQ